MCDPLSLIRLPGHGQEVIYWSMGNLSLATPQKAAASLPLATNTSWVPLHDGVLPAVQFLSGSPAAESSQVLQPCHVPETMLHNTPPQPLPCILPSFLPSCSQMKGVMERSHLVLSPKVTLLCTLSLCVSQGNCKRSSSDEGSEVHHAMQ